MARKGGERPEELLTQNHARELMRQREWTEREALIRTPGDLWIKTHRAPDQKGRRAGVIKALGAPRGEGLARRRSPPLRGKRHDISPIQHAAKHPLGLPPKYLVAAALERLGGDLVDSQPGALVDPALVLVG
jgi:hypothetical protein